MKTTITTELFALALNKPESGIWGLMFAWSPAQQRLVKISVFVRQPTSDYPSPLTKLGILQETAETLVHFFNQQFKPTDIWLDKHLDELKGTPFQLSVWREIAKIPMGQVATYQDLARAIGRPGAMRAVGTACGSNPFPFVVPCHRVVASHGLGGYGLGLPLKRWLLTQEKVKGFSLS